MPSNSGFDDVFKYEFIFREWHNLSTNNCRTKNQNEIIIPNRSNIALDYMSAAAICRVLEKYLLYFAGVLLLPLGVAVLYDFFIEEPYFKTSATLAFVETIGVCLLLSLIAFCFGRKAAKRSLHRKEGIFFVVLIWFITTALAALPFQLTQAIPNPIDAYFESMSGLTTTGASILQPKVYDAAGTEVPVTIQNPLDRAVSYTFYGTVAPLKDPRTGAVLHTGVEALGKPLLFWRSFLQWLGGVGIVVLFISVLPALGVGGKFLYESEMPGLTKEGMTPHIQQTARAIWKIYVGLTFLQIILHMATDPAMSLFDATTLSFSTISTGGFSVHNEGLMYYNDAGVSWIMGFFMVLAGISFALYYHCFKGRFRYLRDPEFYTYIVLLFLGSLIVIWNLWKLGIFSFTETFGDGPFQAISALTTTGFSISNYDLWPMGAQMFMIGLMYVGGMSGSAVGGLKIIRSIVVVRVMLHKIESFFRPNGRVIQIGNKEVSYKTQMSVFAVFCILLFLALLGNYLLILDHVDPLTALGVISTTLTNTGLLFGGIGSQASLGYLSNFGKIISILWMLLGRLEFFALLVLLIPSFWRNK